MSDTFSAVQSGDAETLKTLLQKGQSPNKRKLFGKSLIEIAVENRYWNIVLILFQYGANIEKVKYKVNPTSYFTTQTEFEEYVFFVTHQNLLDFYQKHRKVVFNSFCFEYRYEYGSLLLSLDSVSNYEKQVKKYQKENPEKYKCPKEIERLRYCTGNWKYQAANSYNLMVMFSEMEFVQSINRVLLKLKNEKIFEKLMISEDFIAVALEYEKAETIVMKKVYWSFTKKYTNYDEFITEVTRYNNDLSEQNKWEPEEVVVNSEGMMVRYGAFWKDEDDEITITIHSNGKSYITMGEILFQLNNGLIDFLGNTDAFFEGLIQKEIKGEVTYYELLIGT